MRAAVAVLCAAMLGACSTVKVVQRDNCWVRQTKHFFLVREELGPCSRPEPKWADDRLTRITQECVAQADYRWQSRAAAAWGRGEEVPERPSEEAIQTECMDAASRSELAENDRLKRRLADLSHDRDALAERGDKDHQRLLATYEQIAGDLGQAARRVDAPAYATATSTSEGRATSDGRSATEATQPLTLTGVPAQATSAGRPRVASPRPTAATSQSSQPPPSCQCPAPVADTAAPTTAVEARAEATPGPAAPDTPSPQPALDQPDRVDTADKLDPLDRDGPEKLDPLDGGSGPP